LSSEVLQHVVVHLGRQPGAPKLDRDAEVQELVRLRRREAADDAVVHHDEAVDLAVVDLAVPAIRELGPRDRVFVLREDLGQSADRARLLDGQHVRDIGARHRPQHVLPGVVHALSVGLRPATSKNPT
jgi:hypothetical protein